MEDLRYLKKAWQTRQDKEEVRDKCEKMEFKYNERERNGI